MLRASRRTALSVTGVLVLALALALAGTVVLRGRAEAAAVKRICRTFEHQQAVRLREVQGTGRAVTVIGDSWSVGHKLADLSRSWPSRLPGRVTVNGFSGSGFSARASECGAYSFATRTASAKGADLVIVEGGLNDYDQSHAAVKAGFERLLTRLAGKDVVIVGPAPAPRRLRGAQRVDRWLAALAAKHDVRYLSAIHLRLPYLQDRLHLTAAGHRQFGDWVAAHLS
ncbi:MAG: SGNH/GDSL hydrolase family protein [Nocardioides sp.]|uniref:SGNH/GDSL hydrolase family protein n=1 Tax=Nocardioides sp. TaxID=35761 RepID=UPI0039E36517